MSKISQWLGTWNLERADIQGDNLVNFIYSNWKHFAFCLVLFYLHFFFFLLVWLFRKHPFGITSELSNLLLQIWMNYLLKYNHLSLSQHNMQNFKGKKWPLKFCILVLGKMKSWINKRKDSRLMEGKYYIKTALLNLFIQEQLPRSALKEAWEVQAKFKTLNTPVMHES